MKPEPMFFLRRDRVRIAAQPINWINDDFKDLGADTTLDQCLAEMKEAGYEGSELGHRFPDTGSAIKKQLARYDLQLAAGWHSTFLAERPFEEELQRFIAHSRRLSSAGCDVIIVAECTGAIHSDGKSPLNFASQGRVLDEVGWSKVAQGLDKLAERAALHGIRVAYHEHMGTVIQDAADVDQLMERTQHVKLLLDTGHLRFAGANPLGVLKKHAARVAHVHLKNVRLPVVDEARAKRVTVEQAVRAGVFTGPGDPEGGIEYGEIFEELAKSEYRGWLVVEAEQDPKKANPLAYAKKARAFLREKVGF